ncbi:uncharacterized protein LOC120148246 [Hibiscus syriacus]|uniref:uncharacterized protein LOC120148246 n=1 Tax=Hibiscus syriacus TaxID=106335 RepID=UPI0019209EBE|nr:uncharacterized protein LOC120148246 [Hibiscus syriacus]
MLPQASHRGNMQGRLSYADLQNEILKRGKEVSVDCSSNHKKQHDDIKANEEDKLVKYMPNRPSYLESGASPQEKVLNVGVLQWGRLEKWQCSHKQMLYRSSISSPSSNTSSSFSTDESPAHSSRGHSWSPARQSLQHSSLQSHPMSVTVEGHLPFDKISRESVGKFQQIKASESIGFAAQGKFMSEDISFCKTNPRMKLEKCNRREIVPRISPASVMVSNGAKYNAASYDKVKMKNQVGELMKKAEEFQEVIPNGDKLNVTEKRNTVVLLPRDFPKMNHSGAGDLSNLKTKSTKKETEPSQRTFLETSKEVQHAAVSSNLHCPGPLPCELDGGRHLQNKVMGLDASGSNILSDRSGSIPCVTRIETNSSRSRNLEERKSNVTPAKPSASEAGKGSDPKGSKLAYEKVRSTSPFRRFSFSKGKADKVSGSKEGSSISQAGLTCSSGKTGLQNHQNPASSGVDTSCGDKLDAKSRGRSSPLRRLLDPLLKPKAVNCRSFTYQLQDSILPDGTFKSSEQLRHSAFPVQSTKVKSDTSSHCTSNANDSAQNKKCGSSAVQALFRVQVKNGLPLFTFAVDNESNILAATVKMLSASGKGDYGCIYTFFAIHEVRKKNGRWINQGKGQDYVPNVVAQMKVSGSQFSHMSRPNYVDQFSIREFVLLAFDVGQANPQASDFQSSDEQAAIVVKIPKRNRKISIRDRYLIDKRNNLSEATLKELQPGMKLQFDSGKNGPSAGSQDISGTVILPSGVHSLPNKGEPSSLIQRWKSGGACDCGGWDLGCKLGVLSNKSQFSQRSSFELFSQGGAHDKKPFSAWPLSRTGSIQLSLILRFLLCKHSPFV